MSDQMASDRDTPPCLIETGEESAQPWERPECRCPDCRDDYDPYADEETDSGE